MPTETLIIKDSKNWIGNIPDTWEVKRLKYVMDNYDYLRQPIDASQRTQESDTLYNYYGASGVIDKIDDYICEGEKILIGEDGANLKMRTLPLIYIANGKYWVNNHAHILYPKNDNNLHFFAHQMESIDYENFITGSAQPKLSQENLNNVLLIAPPTYEQKAIADFLDEKCKKIDKVANEIGEQIQILEEYKKSLITETITKGLDENVPLKDSGINYLGKIPVHYKVIRLKYLLSGITDGTHGTFDRYAEGEYLLSAKNVFEDGLHIEENESLISEKDYREIVKNGFPRKGDVLVCCVGTIGRTCVYDIDKPFAFQRSVVFLRPNNKVKSKYLQYLMQAESSQIQMQLYANASAQAGIYMGTLQTIIVIEVPIDEQEQIIGYLDKECEKIDKIITEKKEQLETIKKYKKSLIYEYVTGKKRVAC